MQVNNVSFKKRLIAYASILNKGEPEPVYIYRLKKREDKNYIKNLRHNENWTEANFLVSLCDNFSSSFASHLSSFTKPKFFAIEDEDGDTLCLSQVNDFRRKRQSLQYIEVPKEYSYYGKKGRKYVGETMLAFLAKLQKNMVFPKEIIVDYPVIGVRDFYKKSQFEYIDRSKNSAMHLPEDKVEDLIKQNEEHVKSPIKFIFDEDEDDEY